MKITINYTTKEIDNLIPVARNLDADNDDVMNMINDFEIGGKNLSIRHSAHDKTVEVEIDEGVIARFLRKLNPFIDMIKSFVKFAYGFCSDMADEFDDVKVKKCHTKASEKGTNQPDSSLTEHEKELVAKASDENA